jgi:Eco57I restriction-modification methylase/restriction-modification enzyme MmeI-like protein
MASKRISDKQHRWLSQVEVTGVVFSEPVLADAAPAGFPSLDKQTLARFYKAREIWNLPKGMLKDDGQSQWIEFVLSEILRLRRSTDWLVGAAIPLKFAVNLVQQQETLRPTRVLIDDGVPVLAVLEVPRLQSLDRPWTQGDGKWKASPTTKLERLLRESGIELGLVTNGEAWRLIVASPSETASWITWTAQSWADSPITLAAFRDLLGEERFFASTPENVVLELIKRSRERQLDVADQLGNQVREALSLLVRELDRAGTTAQSPFLNDFTEVDIFEASVAFIMRMLFMLYSEENGLLPHGSTAYDTSYGILHLLTELENQHRISPDDLNHSYTAYSRILASARLLYYGSIDPDIRVASHGGTLFDPDYFPLLEGRKKDGTCATEHPEPPRVSDAVVRQILRSLKYARSEGSHQLVSYRMLAVEQIGHMYEGLLDRRVSRAPKNEALLVLKGSNKVPIPAPLPVSAIEGFSVEELLKFVAKHTGRTKKSLADLLAKPEQRIRFPDPGTNDPVLLAQAEPVRRFLIDGGIVRPGGCFVTTGQDRRSQGAHYTPPALTAPIVRTTLQPVLDALGDNPTPKQILDLKICDPAMGSGAFLVQAVHQLAEHLVDSWETCAITTKGLVHTMPFGTPSQGAEEEVLLPESREEKLVWARRYVAERCIFGIDKNKQAVEMAKLSLWISTLSTDRPFTFLDHALKHGDALVGLNREQIQSFRWKEFDHDLGPLFERGTTSVKEAKAFREELHDLPDHDYAGKQEYLRVADDAVDGLRLTGDLCAAAFFSGKSEKEREQLRRLFQNKIDDWKAERGDLPELNAIASQMRHRNNPIIPFHWQIEFPEVFGRKNPGFDSIVGNPPFLGGKRISTLFGKEQKDWLKEVHPGASGNADLVAHFFRRAFGLMRNGGTCGLIATNTIAQGDTRRGGLRVICESGGEIFSCNKRYVWPSAASVVVSIIHIYKGQYCGQRTIDGRRVDHISAYLHHRGGHSDPHGLISCRDLSFIGCDIKGQGFLFDDGDALASPTDLYHRLVAENPSNLDVLVPYMSGEEINESPTHTPGRWVISFEERDLQSCEQWPELLDIVREKVRPERMTKSKELSEWPWWRFWRTRKQLYDKMAGKSHVLALSRVNSWVSIARVPTNVIYSEAVVIFALDGYSDFSVLQSRVHELWARFFSSTALELLRYSPSNCLETFPFPENWQVNPSLEAAGKAYHEFRAQMMILNGEGLTKTYNRFNDPEDIASDIAMLRELHTAIDQAVLGAYGWSDISTDCEFLLNYEIDEGVRDNKKKPYRYRLSDDVHDEILSRLLELNEQRHTEEITGGAL